jgi:hypothetical protein
MRPGARLGLMACPAAAARNARRPDMLRAAPGAFQVSTGSFMQLLPRVAPRYLRITFSDGVSASM